jgi:ribulose-phosphate 3-epimerase
MPSIIPAIIPESREYLEKTLFLVSGFTHEVQIDIVDGKFVPFTSWPYGEGDSTDELKSLIKDFNVEVDLMVEEPETVIESYLQVGVRKVVIHLESTKKLKEIIAQKERYDFRLGFSINSDTDLQVLTSVIGSADYVQLMGIAHIGSQGQPFDTRVLTRITELLKINPNVLISIDGSVNLETLPQLYIAGARRFVAGSSILKAGDPKRAFETLRSLIR